MKGKAKTKRTTSTRMGVTKRDRLMTDKESSELLESASQALAMVQVSKLIGGRISVRRRLPNRGHETRKILLHFESGLTFPREC